MSSVPSKYNEDLPILNDKLSDSGDDLLPVYCKEHLIKEKGGIREKEQHNTFF